MSESAHSLFWIGPAVACFLSPFPGAAQQDITPPTIESAASVGGSYIGVSFSERVQVNSAQDEFNCSVNDGAVGVALATLRADGRSVLLKLNSVLNGTFSVTVNSILDLSGLSIAEDATVTGEVWASGTDVAGTPPGNASPPGTNFSCKAGDVDVMAGGADIWGQTDEFHLVYQRRTGDFDVAVKLQRLEAVNRFSQAGLLARETLHGNSKSIEIVSFSPDVAIEPFSMCLFLQRPETGSPTFYAGPHEPTDLPNAWMRLKRSGDFFTAYQSTDGLNWRRLGNPVYQAMTAELLVGMVTTSANPSQRAVAEFRNFSELRGGQPNPTIVGLISLQDQTVGSGQPVTFLAEVPGSSGDVFQWQKNGVDLPGATGAVYTISAATPSHSGAYSVRVRNAYGAVDTSAATLIVNEATQLLVPYFNVWRYEASGTDLGTSWKEPQYFDGQWPTGPAPLGFETTPEVLPIQLRTPITRNNKLTYYFRSRFMFTNDPADVSLTLTNLLDDGAVIYLNGVELLRPGMAEGVVTFNTPGYTVVPNASLEWWERVPSTLLRRGENSIAVEMHQNSLGSSDMVFGLAMTAVVPSPTELTVITEPQDLVAEALKSATLEVKVTGNRPRYQWFKGATAIVGATQSSYTITNASTEHQGSYHVTVSNAVNMLRSRDVSLNVIADTVPPLIIKANGTVTSTTVEAIFSEPLTLLSATNRANYTITNTMGGTLPITQATLRSNSTVVLTTSARQSQQNYWLLVRNVQDRAAPPNTITPDRVVPISSLVQLIPAQTDWLYYDTVVDPPLVGTAWRQEGYDTTDWFTLPAAFVLDGDAVPLPLPTRTVLSQGEVTTYFRRQFNFGGSAAANLRFRHYVDDGAVFYLNGVEVLRYNMPSGSITDQTFAASIIGKAWPIETNLPASLLRTGTNLMAVELHGRAALDTDLFFALELQAEVESFPLGPLLIAEQPHNQTVREGQPVTFRVVGTGAATLQWERDGQPIAGATQSTFTIPAANPNMNGFSFAAVLSNGSGGSLRSGTATLTVVADHEEPRILGASGQANIVTLKFSEPVNEASATQTAHYSLRETVGRTLQITRAEIGANPSQVILTTEELADGIEHRVEVNGVTDQASVPNPVPPGTAKTFTSFVFTPGLVKAEYYGGNFFRPDEADQFSTIPTGAILGEAIVNLTSHPTFPDAPKATFLRSSWELSRSNDQGSDYGARLTGFFIPRETGPHIFYLSTDDNGELWLSTDAQPAHKVLIAREPVWANPRQWTGTTGPDATVIRPNRENISAPIPLVAGRTYYLESLMKAGGTPNHMAVAVQQPSDPGPPAIGSSPIPSMLLGGYWENPGLSPRITITRQPVPQTGESGQRLTLQVGVHVGLSELHDGTPYYQWQRNGVDISGAIGAFYTTPFLTAADDGAEYRVLIRTVEGNALVSEAVILSVVSPNTPAFLQINKRADGNAVISWERSGFLLQRSDNLPGIWEPASTQVSPSVVPPSEAREFFRLIRK